MADVNETQVALSDLRYQAEQNGELTVIPVTKLLSAVENVLALCDKALAVKVAGSSEGDVAMAAVAAQVRKAITDALGATDE